jgi:hypothetical protein
MRFRTTALQLNAADSVVEIHELVLYAGGSSAIQHSPLGLAGSLGFHTQRDTVQ